MPTAYLAKFHHNEDGSYTVIFPDLEGCITEGKDLSEALDMASKALRQWLQYLKDEGQEIPLASLDIDLGAGETGHWILTKETQNE